MYDPKPFALHSLQEGGATAATNAGTNCSSNTVAGNLSQPKMSTSTTKSVQAAGHITMGPALCVFYVVVFVCVFVCEPDWYAVVGREAGGGDVMCCSGMGKGGTCFCRLSTVT